MSGGHYAGAAPGKDLVTITTASGRRLTVHKDAAPSFKRFVDQLEGRGYKINSLGGFANRDNRSAAGRKSEHAFGNAIDINPESNPFRSDRTDMPADVSKMAAESGLSWGGDWRHKDNMHFEWRGSRPWEKKKESPSVAKIGETPKKEDLNRPNEEAYRSKRNPFRKHDAPAEKFAGPSKSAEPFKAPEAPALVKLACARAMGGAVGRGLSYLVGERGPEVFTPGAGGQISTNGILGKLADAGRAVTEGSGTPIAPSPERVARAGRGGASAAPAGGDRSFHAGEHHHNWNITSSHPEGIRNQVEGIFGDLMQQMASEQSGLLSD